MLKNVAIALVGLVVVVLGVAATRPDTFTVTRSTSMAAPPSVAYALVSDFHKWNGWSPWDKLDPAMKRTFDGPAAGTGARYAWVGNDQVGEGRMTITAARPDQEVAIKLEFLKPFASESVTTFAFAPSGTSTTVSWTMTGRNNLMSKLFSLVKSMDDMVGPDFAKGLASMKELAEAEAKADAERTAKAAADAAASAAAAAAAPAPTPAAAAAPTARN